MRQAIILLYFIVSASVRVSAQTPVYGIGLETVDGKTISLSDYRGRKVMVAAIDLDKLEKKQLLVLDSLQSKHPGLVILLIPGANRTGDVDSGKLEVLKKSTCRFLIAMPSAIKRSGGAKQGRLLSWLTTSAENGHFDREILNDSHYFLISESGILYASLEKDVSLIVLDEIITQRIVQ